MCTSLNLSPDSTRGSDVQLIPLKNTEGWQVKEITERGKEFLAGICDLLSDSNEQAAEIAKVEKKFDLNTVTKKLNGNGCFDSDLWSKMSPRCLGCGVCTYLCPTCHCFDIQDEGDTYHGVRRKNWDSCSFEMFTMHTSGHNPRPNQSSRWRQRIMHKFNYFPEKFKDVSCSGCGRCTRNCPVDMGITETLQTLSNS
jgi:ferredoxin